MLPELQINEKPAFFDLKRELKLISQESSEDLLPRSHSTNQESSDDSVVSNE